ncbi:MAG: hypothetical protein QOC99_3734 [Acidobacteriota bacterium]|jgi:hypothetical protein|nr:hypothetical protein [Acidobacteriota bacterium]
MAEERNVGLARAPEGADAPDATKAELQRRMEEARESITQTVSEIKDTVVTQYQQVKDNISDTLDWREHYKRHTLPFTAGAFVVGALVGYGVRGAFGSDDDDDYDEDDALDQSSRSYASAPILGGAAASAYQSGGKHDADVGPDTRPSYSSGYRAAAAPPPQQQGLASYASAASEEEEPKGPGVFERFKETKAYDKLQNEISTLGERFVDELSRTAQTVVVPALLSKLKNLIGIDLSTQREVAQRSQVEQQTAQSTAQTAASVASSSTAG